MSQIGASKTCSKAGKQVVKQVPVGRPSDITDSACETLALVLYRVLRIVERPDLYDTAGVAGGYVAARRGALGYCDIF
jgi:hypothetical protein